LQLASNHIAGNVKGGLAIAGSGVLGLAE
jgi:hypothetical protein